MSILANQRNAFAIPRNVHYFNCGYMSPLPRVAAAALGEGAAVKSSPWTHSAANWFSLIEDHRARAARLVGSAADAIALVPSASYGIAIAARNVPIGHGQNVVVLGQQFPSNYYAWSAKADMVGAAMRVAQRDADDDWTAAVLAAIDADTAVVTVPQCHWADGRLVDLVEVATACRAVGAALVLDLTQSLGAMPFDLAAVQPDFMVAAGYKWQLAPYGTALLYVAPRWHDGEPVEQNWLNRAGAEDFSRLSDYTNAYRPGARRYDYGECANPPLLMGAGAALDLIDGWGVANIAATLAEKTGAIAEAAQALGYAAAPTELRAPHFLALALGDADPQALLARLAAGQVFASVRGTSLRLTPHLYNDDADVAALLGVLADR